MQSSLFRSFLCAAAIAVSPLGAANAADAITEEEAHDIGVNAYLYFYPLITMDITRKQLTNVEAKAGSIGGPPNSFANIPEFPPADMKVVVRPNFDTLYSSAWVCARSAMTIWGNTPRARTIHNLLITIVPPVLSIS